MPDFTVYKTTVPTRWDTIARAEYGDSSEIEPIISANPSIPINQLIPAGTNVLVPVIEKNTSSSTVKPPWAD